MTDDWGPWIEHDGMGPPAIPDGQWIRLQGVNYDGSPHDMEGRHEAWMARLPQWAWARYNNGDIGQIHRYRIRKPRGLVILESLLENMPEQVDA